MSVEEIVKKIDFERGVIDDASEKIKKYTEELMSIGDEDWDWVSVKKAAEIMDVSITMIYRKIDTGILNVRHFGSKKFVRRSELKGIDDRESS